MRISDWSSDVCSSDLIVVVAIESKAGARGRRHAQMRHQRLRAMMPGADRDPALVQNRADVVRMHPRHREADDPGAVVRAEQGDAVPPRELLRSEEHTSELQSLMRSSYAAFCLKK